MYMSLFLERSDTNNNEKKQTSETAQQPSEHIAANGGANIIDKLLAFQQEAAGSAAPSAAGNPSLPTDGVKSLAEIERGMMAGPPAPGRRALRGSGHQQAGDTRVLQVTAFTHIVLFCFADSVTARHVP